MVYPSMGITIRMEVNMLKIGIDIHGVIDSDPEFFSQLSKMIVNSGGQIHVITGQKDTPELREKMQQLGISFTHFFSITTHHETIGTKIWYDEKNRPWMDAEIWNRTKAEYCQRNGITMHIDDSPIYGQYFTGTIYLLYNNKKAAIS
jgi:hypothetical protein